MPQSVVLISTSEKNPQYLNLLYFRVVLHQICAADIRKWSSYHIICKSSPKELVHAGNQDAMRGSVPLSKPTWRHAKIFSGVNKYLTPTCLWMMTKACQLSKNLSTGHQHTKAWVCKTKSSNTCKRSHVIHFTSWHKRLIPQNLVQIFYLAKMFDSLKSWNTFLWTILEGDRMIKAMQCNVVFAV